MRVIAHTQTATARPADLKPRRTMLASLAAAFLAAACASVQSADETSSGEAAAVDAGPVVEGEAITCGGAQQPQSAPPFDALAANDAVRALIKRDEGLRLEAYTGPGGKLLIGYGHGGNVTPGMTITEAQAEALLTQDLEAKGDVLKRAITQPMTANEFSAMLDLAYNIGTGNFRSSTLLKKFNAGDRDGAAEEFLRWNKVGGQPNAHLSARRAVEREIFLCTRQATLKAT